MDHNFYNIIKFRIYRIFNIINDKKKLDIIHVQYKIYKCKNFSVFFNKYKPIFDSNSSESDESYDSECTTLFSTYSRNTDSFKPDCIKCMNYLKHLDDFDDQECHERGIIYLYLWLYYYEVRNKINGENTLENMKKLMNLFETHHKRERNIHNVYNNHIERVLNNELNDLFYLYEKFDNFKKKKNCLDNICKCGQDCIQRYKSSIEKCGSNSNMYFCNELENFRNQYNEYRLTEKDCPEVDLYLPPYKKYSTSVIILISFITISVLSSLLFILYKVITIYIHLFIVQ
ncbi:hypothetical protein PVNG_05348 [Plasmodium vivax North Korean]|uniref:Variable surface protein n=1 Tax=Plasmodium vivax North Korean TaxID=1035514 RepID=A0A0J9U1G1_PLAVI|nr:hypothetical protein PVNG_05348 [Plasmodium vivax North Korean]